MEQLTPTDAIEALRARGIHDAQDLVEDIQGTPEQIIATCHKWDTETGVRPALLVHWLRTGKFASADPEPQPAISKGAQLRARFDEYVRRHPEGSIAEPHATLIARRWPTELDFDTCPGDMVITAADYPIVEMDCNVCGFSVGASARQLHLIGSET